MILHCSEATVNLKMYYLCVCVHTHTHTPYLPVYKTIFFLGIQVIWDVILCYWVCGSWHFEWSQCLYIQWQAEKEVFFFCDCLNPEDGGTTFLQKAGSHSSNNKTSHHIPEDPNPRQLCCHNLTSHYVLPIHHLKNRRFIFYWNTN